MVTCLSALTSLKQLHLTFNPQSDPYLESQRPHLSRHSVLPSLTTFGFEGAGKYLEDFVAHIDAPRLSHLTTTLFDRFSFDTSQLVHFISRTPNLKAPDEAHVLFWGCDVCVTYSSRTPGSGEIKLRALYNEEQIWSLVRVYSSFALHLSTVGDLYIHEDQYLESYWQDDDFQNTQWSGILRPFTTVKNLYLCKRFAPLVAPALQEIAEERATEVLPILQNIFLEGLQPSVPVHECIDQFVAARQLSGHPIAVSVWVISWPEGDESNESASSAYPTVAPRPYNRTGMWWAPFTCLLSIKSGRRSP
jgi:hypothetical protein